MEEEEKTEKQRPNNFDWLKAHQWQKGQSGNPNGRPKEKTLKEFVRSFLANLTDEQRMDYLKAIDPKVIWEMAEGKPKQDLDVKGEVTSKVINVDE